MEHNDQLLIAQILDGNDEAYRELIDRYKNGLYYHCFQFVRDEDEAEDLAQQAFIEAFVHLDSYDSHYKFSTWLYKIATNLALMHIRKRRNALLGEEELDQVMSNLPGTEELALQRELHEAVDRLPLRYRTVVSMHYWQGKSYAEIASSMGTSVGSIKGWMSRAKRQLKEALS